MIPLPSASIVGQLLIMGAASAAALYRVMPKNRNPKHERMQSFFQNTRLHIKKGDAKITPRLLEHQKEKHGDLYVFSIPNGLNLDRFLKEKQGLEHQLEAECQMWAMGRKLYVRAMTETIPEYIDYSISIARDLAKCKMGMPIGHSHQGYLINDFTRSSCHVLVGGTTDSGKSVFLRQAITSMMMAYSPSYLHLNLVDLKGGVEHDIFNGSPHVHGFAETEKEAADIFSSLNREVDRRAAIIKKAGADSVHSLNMEMPYIVTVVDEFADIRDDETMENIERILRMARFAGIYMVLATQRPDAKVLPGRLKGNLPVSICFRCKNSTESRIILDNARGNTIPPIPGRAYYQLSEDIEFQTPFLSKDAARGLLQKRFDALHVKEKERKEQEFQGVLI